MKPVVMMMLAVLLAGVHVAFADWTPGRSFDYFDKTSYKDRDWNVEFYENCQMPDYHSAQWVEEDGERFLRFTLKNGQVGDAAPTTAAGTGRRIGSAPNSSRHTPWRGTATTR